MGKPENKLTLSNFHIFLIFHNRAHSLSSPCHLPYSKPSRRKTEDHQQPFLHCLFQPPISSLLSVSSSGSLPHPSSTSLLTNPSSQVSLSSSPEISTFFRHLLHISRDRKRTLKTSITYVPILRPSIVLSPWRIQSSTYEILDPELHRHQKPHIKAKSLVKFGFPKQRLEARTSINPKIIKTEHFTGSNIWTSDLRTWTDHNSDSYDRIANQNRKSMINVW